MGAGTSLCLFGIGSIRETELRETLQKMKLEMKLEMKLVIQFEMKLEMRLEMKLEMKSEMKLEMSMIQMGIDTRGLLAKCQGKNP